MFSNKKFTAVFVIALIGLLNTSVFAADKKDCVECGYKNVVGSPSAGNLDGLAKLAKSSLSQDESYDEYYKLYCMRFEQLSNNYAFKKDMLESMKKSPYPVDKYWTEVGCRPSRIGGTSSPIIHLVAEEVGGRKQFIELLHKYYVDRKDTNAWIKVVNSKNTRGHTLLDYIDYLNTSKELRSEEREDMNELIKFLCDRGAVFSSPINKCPMSI